MEERLQKLIHASSPTQSPAWAKKWKKQGNQVIGTLCSYIPEEIIQAAGMLPWRITGAWRNIILVEVYYPQSSCSFCMHVLESLLAGELDFLDGVVMTDWSDDTRRLWDIWTHVGKPSLIEIIHIPHQDTALARQELAKELSRFTDKLEKFTKASISTQRLRQEIDTNNRVRDLLTRLYQLRKRVALPLTGAEVMGITLAAMVMPKEQFAAELEALLPCIEGRTAKMKANSPRLMVSSDKLDNPEFLELIEEAGCAVVMDDLDTGSRYFWGPAVNTTEDPFAALAQRYIERPPCPRMYAWESQVAQVTDWVNEFNIDGVVELVLEHSRPREIRTPFLRTSLEKAGIPFISLTRDYYPTNIGQFKTRIEAFVETIRTKKHGSPVS
ncbi:2-hydroxyacyl-CoA dehydratase subunit D [Chloroflexota bacterium]